ncbi:MAG: hypothetical protein ACRD1Y_01660 [Terriglobales bacterium]
MSATENEGVLGHGEAPGEAATVNVARNPEAKKRTRPWPRKPPGTPPNPLTCKFTGIEWFRANGRLGAKAAWAKLTPERRREHMRLMTERSAAGRVARKLQAAAVAARGDGTAGDGTNGTIPDGTVLDGTTADASVKP